VNGREAMAVSAAIMLAAAVCGAQEQHPCLSFGADDLPELRARADRMPEVRDAILSAAEDLLGPGRVDPERIGELGGESRQAVRGHAIGRRLTEWLETLGFAWQLTGDERFGREGARLLASVRGLPPDEPPVGPGAFAGARGDILRAMVIGYDWLYAAMTEEQRQVVAEMMARYVEDLLGEAPDAWWMPYHNFIGVAVGACGAASIVLAERFPERAGRWRQQCVDLIELWLRSGFDEEGAYAEGVGYSFYGLDNATLFMDALARAGAPDLFAHAHLQRFPHFLAQSLLPGERVFDARNDSGYTSGNGRIMLRLAAEGLPLAKWLWQRTGGANAREPWAIVWANEVQPRSPADSGEPLSALFPGRGLAVFRTGWDAGGLMFSVEAGRYYAITHDQADKGHFTLYGRGGRWAIDSGYGNNREPEGKAQTVAHNCVLIDGRGQAITGASYGTDGAILAYEATDDLGYALADATEAYLHNNRGDVGVALQRAQRHCFFVRPADGAPGYAIVVDDIIVDGAEHEYDWLLHTASGNRITPTDGGFTIEALTGASGGGYVVTPEDTTGSGEAGFAFTAQVAGDYHVWARVRAGGEVPTKSDSFRVGVDDGQMVDWHLAVGGDWAWREVHELQAAEPTTFRLDVGEHVLHIATREPEAQIDALFITPDAGFVPAAAAPDDATYFEAEDAATIVAPMVVRHEAGGASPTCAVRFAWLAGPEITVDGYDDHPRAHVRASMVDGRFAAVLVPLADGEQPPTVTGADGEVTIAFGAVEDRLAVTYAGGAEVTRWRLSRTIDGNQRWTHEGPALTSAG